MATVFVRCEDAFGEGYDIRFATDDRETAFSTEGEYKMVLTDELLVYEDKKMVERYTWDGPVKGWVETFVINR